MRTVSRHLVFAGAGIVALSSMLAGCGTDDGKGRQSLSRRPDEPPARIVSLLPAVTEIITGLGARDRLVAQTTGELPESGLVDVGNPLDPRLEVIAKASPDLIVAWYETDLGPLHRTLPPGSEILPLRIQTLDDLRHAIRLLGSLLDLETRAEALLAVLEEDLRLARQTGRSAGSPLVAWVVWHDPLTLAGRNTFIDEVLAVAGGRNVVAKGEGEWPVLSIETLLAREPDIVVWPEGAGVPPPAMAPAPWGALLAGRRVAVVTIPADEYQVPGPSIGAATGELARRLVSVRSVR